MQEQWIPIQDYPQYGVSPRGEILHFENGRVRSISQNQEGISKVTLFHDGMLLTKSVALLVAQAYVENPKPERFSSPIHLNGDKSDCRAENLMWRPRWFTVNYHRQFNNPAFHNTKIAVENCETGDIYDSPYKACTTLGILYLDVVLSLANRTPVFPLYQRFQEHY